MIMFKYIKYLWYLTKHKWFVGIELFKEGYYWLAITHDISKFRWSEFKPYTDYFFGSPDGDIKKGRGKSGAYKAGFSDDEKFNFAWLLHQKRNKHHWQWWVLPSDRGELKAFEIPERYMIEMICDWKGAGRAQNSKIDTKTWYELNGNNMILHYKSRKLIENKLYINTQRVLT